MTEKTNPDTATTGPDWIPEVDESGKTPKETGRYVNRWSGETREGTAADTADTERTVNAKTGEIRDAAGHHEGYEKGSRGDDSYGSAPDPDPAAVVDETDADTKPADKS